MVKLWTHSTLGQPLRLFEVEMPLESGHILCCLTCSTDALSAIENAASVLEQNGARHFMREEALSRPVSISYEM